MSAGERRIATYIDNALAVEIAKEHMGGNVVDEFKNRAWATWLSIWCVPDVSQVPRI